MILLFIEFIKMVQPLRVIPAKRTHQEAHNFDQNLPSATT